MATKYEIEVLAQSIQNKHKYNLNDLQTKLRDCKDLLRLYQDANPGQRERFNDRQFLLQTKRELCDMINEEKAAIKSAYHTAASKLGQF